MSNCQRFEVPRLELVGWHLVSAALRPILHTIVFTRSFGPTEPRELHEDGLGVSYGAVKDPETEKYLAQKIQEFVLWLQRRPSHSGTLKLAFRDRPLKKSRSSFFLETGACWEEWLISVKVFVHEVPVDVETVTQSVKDSLEFIMRSVATNHYPLPSLGNMTLLESFSISVVTENKTYEFLHAVHRAVQDVSTTSLLR